MIVTFTSVTGCMVTSDSMTSQTGGTPDWSDRYDYQYGCLLDHRWWELRLRCRCLLQVFLGGSIINDSKVKVLDDPENQPQPQPRIIKVPQTGGSEIVSSQQAGA